MGPLSTKWVVCPPNGYFVHEMDTLSTEWFVHEIALINRCHYVKVDLQEGHPLANVSWLWNMHKSARSIGWQTLYQARLNAYVPPYRPTNLSLEDKKGGALGKHERPQQKQLMSHPLGAINQMSIVGTRWVPVPKFSELEPETVRPIPKFSKLEPKPVRPNVLKPGSTRPVQPVGPGPGGETGLT
ncbi:hypothetical protein LXL04_011511 [Taraxacum kok-saghyz]